MNPINTLEALIDRPETITGPERPAGLGRAGLLGYFSGTLGLFMFLRMQGAVPPGVFSFLSAYLFVLAANFFFAGVIHLFMDLTCAAPSGANGRGRAARLFLAFGCTDYLLALLVPLGFLSGVKVLNGFLWFGLCFLAVIYARVRLIRRLYTVSVNKALLSVWLPYGGIFLLFFAGLVYGMIWLFWLIM
ncbi:MAG: hypothetical protein A2X35_00040 [Elusimicrobia bacterium GWA2_61_42]|nr:MAG: hypothetical protein A2X35_00040 [Elusimicrobia bacterium GWA2_61_42]OGR78083.1 MAG: hypothetical protein A2X38_06745 [Elusimicrobia bacterium GWC2_61_25]